MKTITFETKVLDIIQRTHDVKSFRFPCPSVSAGEKSGTKERMSFKAGQYFFVTIKVNGIEVTKPFSFSNSPTETCPQPIGRQACPLRRDTGIRTGYIEFTKRITDSDFSKALEKLQFGERVKLKMPYGSFTFEGEYPKIAFLSGGIGITPIRSICKFVIDKKLSTDIVLIYGSRKVEDIVFRDDFTVMQKLNKKIKVVYTLDSPVQEWCGRVGFINDDMIKAEIPDFKERVFYICGPPKMVEGLVNILKNKLSVEETKIKIENFAGY